MTIRVASGTNPTEQQGSPPSDTNRHGLRDEPPVAGRGLCAWVLRHQPRGRRPGHHDPPSESDRVAAGIPE
jgi:hypothetical protein